MLEFIMFKFYTRDLIYGSYTLKVKIYSRNRRIHNPALVHELLLEWVARHTHTLLGCERTTELAPLATGHVLLIVHCWDDPATLDSHADWKFYISVTRLVVCSR